MTSESPRAAALPERLGWAVEMLAPAPDAEVLEIGCGRGLVADLLCRRVPQGRIVAVDRSTSATDAARDLLAPYLVAGRAEVHTAELAGLDAAVLGRFDAVLAVNVNLFWVGPVAAELQALGTLLRPGGRLHLVYETPGGERRADLLAALLPKLFGAGWEVQAVDAPEDRPALLAVACFPS